MLRKILISGTLRFDRSLPFNPSSDPSFDIALAEKTGGKLNLHMVKSAVRS